MRAMPEWRYPAKWVGMPSLIIVGPDGTEPFDVRRDMHAAKIEMSRSNYVIKWTFALPTGQREAEQMLS